VCKDRAVKVGRKGRVGVLLSATVYFEDFYLGQVIDLGSRAVPREEVLEFARAYDPQPFHTDDEAAKKSIYGGLIASGWHTCAMMMRMLYDGLINHAASMGSPGIDNIRWLKRCAPATCCARR
jgi:acyl dehydratase